VLLVSYLKRKEIYTDTFQRTAPQGSPRTPATCITATTPELIVGIFDVYNCFLTFCFLLHFSILKMEVQIFPENLIPV